VLGTEEYPSRGLPWLEVLHDAFAWRIDRALLALVALAAATRCECVVQEAVEVVEGFVEEDRHFDVDLRCFL